MKSSDDNRIPSTIGRIITAKNKGGNFLTYNKRKLPLIIDSSGLYDIGRAENNNISSYPTRSFFSIIHPFASSDTVAETAKESNFKCGVSIKVGPEIAVSDTSKDNKIQKYLKEYTSFESYINSSCTKTEFLKGDDPNAIFFRQPTVLAQIKDSNKRKFIQNVINAIGYVQLYKYSESKHDKVDKIIKFYEHLLERIPLLPSLDSFHGGGQDELESRIKNLSLLLLESEVSDLYSFRGDLIVCDANIFRKDNLDLFKNSVDRLSDDVSIFYYFYRMGALTYLSDTSDLNSSPSPTKTGYMREEKTSKQINIRYERFITYLVEKISEGGSPKAYKIDAKKVQNTEPLTRAYAEFDRVVYDLFQSYNYDLDIISETQEFKNVLSGVNSAEEQFVKAIFGERINMESLSSYSREYILEAKELIDDKFDSNDFAICWDAVTNGLPIITGNVEMLQQTRANISRTFFLGRDVQIIIVKDILSFFSEKYPTKEFSEDRISDYMIWEYCYHNLDMTKLWGMTGSDRGKFFSRNYDGKSWPKYESFPSIPGGGTLDVSLPSSSSLFNDSKAPIGGNKSTLFGGSNSPKRNSSPDKQSRSLPPIHSPSKK